jgi:hypothetical protein
MTKGDIIISYFLDNEGIEVEMSEVVSGTGLQPQQIATTIWWLNNTRKINGLVRLRKGVYCFKPKFDVKKHRSHAEIAYDALKENDRLKPEQLAEIIDVPVSYVYQVIKLVKQKYPVKIKRQVTYEVIK